MAEHKRNKAGLHKGISSIFKGVPIPQADGGQEPSGPPAPERTDNTGPKQPAPETQKPQVPKAYQATQTLPKAAPEHTATEPKQPTPEPQKTQAPKAYQATQTLPKAAPAQKPKADTDDIKKYASKKPAALKSDSQSFWQQIRNKLSKSKPSDSTTKQKATVVMIPLLFIVLIFMLFRGGVFGTSAGHIEAPVEEAASGVVTAGANTKIDWEVPAPYPTTLRDPMRLVPVEIPQNEQTETRKTIKLIVKGILYTKDNPSAVIGNSIVHEGETIRGVSIIKISTDSVEFEMNGKRWTQKVRH